MTDTKCEFCGSKQIIIETPYVSLTEKGTYEPTTSYCCNAQKRNRQHDKKRFHPLYNES